LIAFFDCFSGASGDMILGALVDAGWTGLREALDELNVPGWRLNAKKVVKRGISATGVSFELEPASEHRHLDDRASLRETVRTPTGALEIRGLDVISEPAIRKMWGEKGGKPFDPEFPDAFLKDVRDQGIFDNLGQTSSETKVNEALKTADVTLIFDGKPAQNPRRKRLGEQP